RAEELGGNQGHVPVDAGHAEPIAAHAGNGARDVRAVGIGIVVARRAVVNRVVAVVRVPAVNVVDVAVAVVIGVVRAVERVGPDIGVQIGVVEVDPLVDHTHVDGFRS